MGVILGCIAAILFYIIGMGVSWLAVCGIVKLITMCFALTFSWAWATGIWLILLLFSWLFGRN